MKKKIHKENVSKIDLILPSDLKPFVKQARDRGANSWLNALPLKRQGFNLNKEEFRDALNICYNLPLTGLPSQCACVKTF